MHNPEDYEESEFSQYDSMTTDQLYRLLRSDAQNTESEEVDVERLMYITEILVKRRKENGKRRDPKAAFDRFAKHYFPHIETASVQKNDSKAKRNINWKRGLVAAAASLVILIGAAATADAFGFNLANSPIKWTDDAFYFQPDNQSSQSTSESIPFKEPAESYQSLEEALEDYNISLALVPTWFPEGYELYDVDVYVVDDQRRFTTAYNKGEDLIKVEIQVYLSFAPSYFEQSGFLEIYRREGIDYYIIQNNRWLHAVWLIDGFECSISGPVTIEEMKMMIDSITKG